MNGKIPVFILFGPTASGKTALLFDLFSGGDAAASAEVISADSMQVYRGMDVGTAKPGPDERARLPHHLLDVTSPGCPFNAGEFVRLADECCAAIYRKNKLPAASGGSGFYLKNFITGLPQTPPGDEQVRRTLKEEYARRGLSPLYAELAERDPASAARIHENDAYRIIRALAVCRETGKPLSAFEAEDETEKKARRDKYDFLVVYVTRKRPELYARINRRVDAMFENGLVDEVKTLFSHSVYSEDNPLFTAIGYREFFSADETGRFFLRDTPIDEIKELIKQNSRRYAKRQETFFNGIKNACRPDEVFRFVIDNDEDMARKNIHSLVRRFWEKHHA